MRSKKSSLVNPTLMWIEAVHKYAPIDHGNLISRVYQLQPYERPLLTPINIAIRYKNKYNDQERMHLYYYDQREGWTFIPSANNKDRGVISGEVKQLDAIAIIEDKSPPLILSSHPGNNGKYPSLELDQIKIRIDDKLSGFDPKESSFDLFLDNLPLIYTYQPKLKIISFDLSRPLCSKTLCINFELLPGLITYFKGWFSPCLYLFLDMSEYLAKASLRA